MNIKNGLAKKDRRTSSTCIVKLNDTQTDTRANTQIENSKTKPRNTWVIYSVDILNIIAGFLSCREAIHLLYVNKTFYAIFLMPILRNSFMSINTNRITNLRHSNIYKVFASTNLHIAGIKKIKEPLFLYIERLFIDQSNSAAWSNLRYISFGRSFNYKIDELPPNIEEIAFHPKSVFNQKITGLKCRALKYIYFGKFFNQKIDFLPQSVEVIHFDHTSRFNKPIRRVPQKLKELYFGQWFNQELDALWQAPKFERLQFPARSKFNRVIAPSYTLHTLSLGMYYNCELNLQNTNLATLRFHKLSRYIQPIQLPPTIRTIIIGEHFAQELNLQNIAELDTLQFYAKSKFNTPLHLPPACKYLVLGRHFNQELRCESVGVIRFAKNSKFRNIAFLVELKHRGVNIQHHLLNGFLVDQSPLTQPRFPNSTNPTAEQFRSSDTTSLTVAVNKSTAKHVDSDVVLDNFISYITNTYDEVEMDV